MLPCRRRSEAPLGWQLFLETYLGASPTLAQCLWQAYEPTCPLQMRYLLQHVGEHGHGASLESVWRAIRPQLLFRLTLALSPERPGRMRDPEVVQLEERILRLFRPGAS